MASLDRDRDPLERLRAAVARLRARGLQVEAPALDRLEAEPARRAPGPGRPPRHWQEEAEERRAAGGEDLELRSSDS